MKFVVWPLLFLFHFNIVEAKSISNKKCRKEFASEVAKCAKTIDGKKREKKKEKVAALKACHAEAREDLKVCLAGDSGSEQPPNPVPDNSACIATCQSNLTSGQLLCAENYDLSQCSGEASCEQLVTQLHANCMNSAQAAYDSCALSCQ